MLSEWSSIWYCLNVSSHEAGKWNDTREEDMITFLTKKNHGFCFIASSFVVLFVASVVKKGSSI